MDSLIIITFLIIILSLLVSMGIREYLHYKQVVKLEELLKSVDVTEYYKARNLNQPQPTSANILVDEPNDLESFDGDLDITKVTKVNIDGVDRDISLL